MKVLLTVRWPVGGIRTFLRYVYSLPVFSDCELTIVAPDQGQMDYLNQHLCATGSVNQIACSPDTNLGLLRAVKKQLQTEDYELVHSHGFTAATLTSLAFRGASPPHLITAHDVFLPDSFSQISGRFAKLLLRRALQRASTVHAVSEDCARNVTGTFPSIDARKTVAILNGVDTYSFLSSDPVDIRKRLDLAPEVGLIGFFGRFMPQKGFRTLVDAAGVLNNDSRALPFRVVTFGSGEYAERDYRYVREKGLDKLFVRLDHVDEPARWMKGVDVVAMPSRWEACGVLAMEVLAAGVPLVSSNCIGLREVVAGTPVTTVDPMDAKALAEALAHELSGKNRSLFAEYASEASRRYDVSITARRLRYLYDEIASLNGTSLG